MLQHLLLSGILLQPSLLRAVCVVNVKHSVQRERKVSSCVEMHSDTAAVICDQSV
jgi:hypothetical protein